MTRQPHDQFAKSLLSEFLEPWGSVEVNREVSDEPRSIDLYFEPDPERPPQDLGLLGRLAALPCLLEPMPKWGLLKNVDRSRWREISS